MMEEKLIEDKFNAAVNVIRSLPKDGPYQPSHDMMLKFYGLYKQATEGPCKDPKPSFYEVVKGYKWRAWNALGSMSKTEAMNMYVEELKKIVETMSYSEDVATFIEALGPFYEYVDIMELPNGKTSDGNHNITEKNSLSNSSESLPENYELITMCNGGVSPKINGIKKLMHEESKDDSESRNSSCKKEISENGTSPLHQALSNDVAEEIPSKLNKENFKTVNSDSCPDAVTLKQGSSSLQKARVKGSINSLKKLISDTDSDEEYSEPAESPELLQEKQRQIINLSENTVYGIREYTNYHHTNNEIESTNSNSPVLEVVTCGGGDASDAERIRLTGGYTSGAQSTSAMRRLPSHVSGRIQSSGSEGGGGGRRRRNSEDPPQSGRSSSVDVNSQLILILQKIHQDLEAVVIRLDALETQALNQHEEVCALCQRRLGIPFRSVGKSSWWPFPELSPRSTFFLLTWPLILHGAVKLLLFLRSRRRKKLAV